MNKQFALKLGRQAIMHIAETDPRSLEWARGVGPGTFNNLRLKQFLEMYCFVVYSSGFKYSIIKEKFPDIKKAFKNFDRESLLRMRSANDILFIFNNERKAESFLSGAKMVIQEGFSKYKKRLARDGMDVLVEMPGIGPVTKHHLAKNIGLADVAKPDVWLERAAKMCDATVAELTDYLARTLGESRHTVDLAIWNYGKDGKLSQFRG